MDADGLSAHPAVSCAEVSAEICDIQSCKGRRMVERMAWKKAGKMKPQAECIAARHAEQRLNERIDAQAAESLEKANQKYNEKFHRPFTERKLFPQMLRFSTTERAFTVTGLQAGGGKVAAPGEPPPVTAEGADMTLRLHESMINNLAFDALAGRTIYEEKVQATAVDLLGHLPDKMKGDEDGKPWAITFAPRQPISVTFADDGFRVTIRGVKYFKGSDAHPAMNVSAAYKIEKSPEGDFRAVRQGGIEAFPPGFVPGGGKKLSGPQTDTPQTPGKTLRQGLRAGVPRQGPGTARQVEGVRQADADRSRLPRRLAGDRLEAAGRAAEGRRPVTSPQVWPSPVGYASA